MTFQDKGQLTDAEAAALQQAFVKTETGQYITDKSAADKSKEIVTTMAASMEAKMKGDTSVAFTVTVVTTNMRTNKEVYRCDIIYNKGNVTTKNY
jgi:hypothetical protein